MMPDQSTLFPTTGDQAIPGVVLDTRVSGGEQGEKPPEKDKSVIKPKSIAFNPAFADLFEPYQFKIYYSGRAGGKSYAFAQALAIYGASTDLRCLFTREYQISLAQSVFYLIKDQIIALGLEKYYDIGVNYIRGRYNKTEFIFKGLSDEARSIKSLTKINVCWVEEGQDISEESWDTLIHTIRDPGSEIWASFNPRFETDVLYKTFVANEPPPNSLVRKVDYLDNPYLTDETLALAEHLRQTDPEKYEHIYGGGLLIRSDAAIYKNVKVADMDNHLPPGTVMRVGLDFGFGQPSACLAGYVWDNIHYIRFERYRAEVTISEMPAFLAGDSPWMDATGQPRWSNHYGHKGIDNILESEIIADSNNPQAIMDLKECGFHIVPVRKGAGSVEEGIAYLQDQEIIIHPDCVDSIREFTTYQYKKDRLADTILPIPLKKNDHCPDAWRYATSKLRRNNVAVSYRKPLIRIV